MAFIRRRPALVEGARTTPQKLAFARRLRQEATDSEQAAWEILRNRRLLGLKFRRQPVVRGFVLDFYCHDLRLAIELDGGVHDGRQDEDARRQRLLEAVGIRFVRLRNEALSRDRLIELISPFVVSG